MNELLQRLYGMIRPQDVQQAATSPLTSPQIGMLNRVLGLSRGQAQTALQRMPEQLAQSQAMLESYTPGGRLDPRLMDQFMNLATMAPMGITAFHGSPYLFRQFDPTKVGAGEGAQAYGVGAGYTAEARPVAERYAEILSNRDIANQNRLNPHANAKRLVDLAGDPKFAADDIRFVLETNPDNPQKELLSKTLDFIESGKYAEPLKTSGYIYKGDIPDEILPKFLDWDKKFSEQTKEVKEAIQKYWSDNKVYGDPTKLTGAGIYDSIVAHVFGDAGRAGAQQAASSELEKIGLRGIRYLDQSSRDVGKGTSNFIPFRPEDYKIQEINDIPIEEYIRQGLL